MIPFKPGDKVVLKNGMLTPRLTEGIVYTVSSCTKYSSIEYHIVILENRLSLFSSGYFDKVDSRKDRIDKLNL